jgi:CheY-like chemotaxis protein
MLDGLKVLYVDDDADVLHIVKKLLAHAHAEVITASSANEALAMIDTARPDVIISDISMPGFDGYQFIESVRGRAILTPAIALTAQTDHDRAIEAGFDAHLAKPMRAKTLISAINTLLASLAHDSASS